MKAFFFLLVSLTAAAVTAQTNGSYDLEPYSSLEVSGPFYVTLERGSQPFIELSGDQDVIDETTVKIQGRELIVRYENKRGRWNNQDRVEITIVFQDLEKLDIRGACNLIAIDRITTDYLELDISGASDVELEVDVNELEGDISGASTVEMSGRTKLQRVDISGASSYKARDLESERSFIDGSGASSATVTAKKEIKAEATGASSIYYYGDPEYIDSSASGAGSVKRRG